jgi:hypothetical protein
MTTSEQAERVRDVPPSRLAGALCLAVTAALLASAFVVGRNAQVAADAAERDEIAREDRTLCAELGFGDPDSRYLRCARGLAEIRRKQKERWDAAIQ